jgi:secondary thiamine-phosphate synthase enzyme
MRQTNATLDVDTNGKGLTEITDAVVEWVAAQAVSNGLLTLFCRHTSASLLIQENAAPAARRDLEAYFERIAPESALLYEHDDEGPDDMPAHLRAALTQTHLAIPLAGGTLMLGRWQGIFLFEHRHDRQRRQIALHLLGD